jgi:hypothetical protein
MRALLLLLAACFAVAAHAGECTPSQQFSILTVAYGQYHGPRSLLENPPPVHVVSQAELRQRFKCDGHCPPIHGLYDEENVQIYVDDGLDFSTVYATTVLMHEYIHHFQAKTKGRLMDLDLPEPELCLEVVAREHEAYRLQWEVLLKSGEYLLAQNVRRTASQLRCTEH